MAERDTTFRLLLDDDATLKLRAFGVEAGRVVVAEKAVAAAGKTIGPAVGGGAREATAAVVKLEKAAGSAGRNVAGLGQAGEAALGRMGRAGEVALGVMGGNFAAAAVNALADVAASVVTANMAMETATADLSAITGIAGDDLERLRQAGIDLSIDTGRSATDSIAAYKLLASSIDVASMGGVAGLERLGEQVVTLAMAAQIDLATAADATANTLNQFGLAAGESGRIVNVLAAGAKFGAAEVNDLSEALRNSGSAASGANLSVEETVGALEVLAQNAQKGSEAGTGLQTMITILQTQTEKLARAGIRDVNIETDGLAATLAKLKPLLGDAAALSEVFGMEGLKTARILITNAEAVDEMTTSVTGTNTAAEQAAVQMDTLAGDVQKLTAMVGALGSEGNGLNDALRDMVQATTEVAGGIRELTAEGSESLGMLQQLWGVIDRIGSLTPSGWLSDRIVGGLREAGRQGQRDRDGEDMVAANAAGWDSIRPAAFRPPPPAPPPAAETPAGADGERTSSSRPRRTPAGPTAAQRAAIEQARDDAEARAESARLEAEATEVRRTTREADDAHGRALAEQGLRRLHQDMAERIALVEDESARRRAALQDDANLQAALHAARTRDIEAEADAAVAAASFAYNAVEDQINRERQARGLSAAEREALDDRLALAAAERDEAQGAASRHREAALGEAALERAAAEARFAEERRRIDADEYEAKKAHADALREKQDEAYEREKEQQADLAEKDRRNHDERMRQMARIQEAADATLQAVGLAVQIYQGLSDRQLQQVDAERAAAEGRLAAEERLATTAHQKRIAEMRARGATEAEMAAAEQAYDTATDANRTALDEKFDARQREVQTRAAKAERAAALFSIAIQTAINVAKSFPNPFAMGAAAALGVAQGASVLAQPIPAFALGTDSAPGGLALVGERGPEIVHVPGGSSVITNERAERLGAAMQALDRSRSPGALSAAPPVVHVTAERYDDARLVAVLERVEGRVGDVEAAVGRIRLELTDDDVGRASRRVDDFERRTAVPFAPL